MATEHRGVCADEFIDIVRVLRSENGKEEIEKEIDRIKKQTEERIHQELEILQHL